MNSIGLINSFRAMECCFTLEYGPSGTAPTELTQISKGMVEAFCSEHYVRRGALNVNSCLQTGDT